MYTIGYYYNIATATWRKQSALLGKILQILLKYKAMSRSRLNIDILGPSDICIWCYTQESLSATSLLSAT